MARKKYYPQKVTVALQDEHRETWKMAGRSVSGREYVYDVCDENFGRLNAWKFAVRVPNSSKKESIVGPLETPGKNVWAGLDRRSIVLVNATKHPHRSKLYCKVNLADPTEEKTKIGLNRGERSLLPRWFKYFKRHMRLKQTVTTTAGTDERSQVVLFKKNDHERMIRLFFALKVWVLHEEVIVK